MKRKEEKKKKVIKPTESLLNFCIEGFSSKQKQNISLNFFSLSWSFPYFYFLFFLVLVLCKVSGPTLFKSTYWFLFALPPWVPMAPEVMLFVWGSEVVPISVKKALLSLIPTHTRMQGSSPQPQPSQPPSLNRTLLSLCQEVNEQTPKGEEGPPPIMICMAVIVWPPWGGYGWLRWVQQGSGEQAA